MNTIIGPGFLAELATAVQIAFYVALPGAMFYVGGVLARLAVQLKSMDEELGRVAERLDRHLEHHHQWGGAERRTGGHVGRMFEG